jgi:hypothetical protein
LPQSSSESVVHDPVGDPAAADTAGHVIPFSSGPLPLMLTETSPTSAIENGGGILAGTSAAPGHNEAFGGVDVNAMPVFAPLGGADFDPIPGPSSAVATIPQIALPDDLILEQGSRSGGTHSTSMSSAVGGSTTLNGGASSGLIINVTYDTSVSSAPAGFTADVTSVVQYFESHFNNPVTINIHVGYGEVGGTSLGSGALGSSQTYISTYSYSTICNALKADATSSAQFTAVANLPSSDPTGGASYYVATAEAKALGLNTSTTNLDGNVGFSSAYGFCYNNSAGVPAGQYDFMGVVAHEISEVMGRLVPGTPYYTPLGLFDYSAPGASNVAASQAGYFSINGGTTNLNNFNSSAGGDLGDWAGSAGNDAFLAFGSGAVMPVKSTDLTLMNVIGWNLAPSGSTTPVAESLANSTSTSWSTTPNMTSNDALTGTGAANALVTLTVGGATIGTTTASTSTAERKLRLRLA